MITGNGYALINDLKTYLPKSSVTEDGYYKPAKKKLLDLNVSDTGFNSAIDFLSRFFDALGKQGYRVTLDLPGERMHRADIDIKEDPKEGGIAGTIYGGYVFVPFFLVLKDNSSFQLSLKERTWQLKLMILIFSTDMQ